MKRQDGQHKMTPIISSLHLCKETGSSNARSAATEAGPLQPGSEHAADFTPGSWAVVQPDGDYDAISVCAFDGDPRDGIMSDVIAEILSVNDEADARAIASIPALILALQRITAATPNSTNSDTLPGFMSWIRAVADTALAHALGREAASPSKAHDEGPGKPNPDESAA